MSAKTIFELTIDDLKTLVREAVREVIEEEEELDPDFAEELLARCKSTEWLSHEEVWG